MPNYSLRQTSLQNRKERIKLSISTGTSVYKLRNIKGIRNSIKKASFEHLYAVERRNNFVRFKLKFTVDGDEEFAELCVVEATNARVHD
jgi:hypothetical protein